MASSEHLDFWDNQDQQTPSIVSWPATSGPGPEFNGELNQPAGADCSNYPTSPLEQFNDQPPGQFQVPYYDQYGFAPAQTRDFQFTTSLQTQLNDQLQAPYPDPVPTQTPNVYGLATVEDFNLPAPDTVPSVAGPAPKLFAGATVDNYSVCSGDLPAEHGPNIEYFSDAGDAFKSSEVRFHPARGWFIPLYKRTKDELHKRSGPRPGTTNEPLYEMCKWDRGTKTNDSEYMGRNVYGVDFDRPEDWELPNGKGTISYDEEGCFPQGFTLTAEQIRLYIDENPRLPHLRISVANAPSQATHRTFNKECIWSGCPNPTRNLRQGFHQVIFDEYTHQTDTGERDPFRVAGRMHLWCYEQCCDIVEDFKLGLVMPENRQLRREQKNVMALNRDCNTTVERETYEPWFRYQIEKTGTTVRFEPHPFEESLAYVLTKHHLKNQAKRRQNIRDARNQFHFNPKSLDITEGNLLKYHELDGSVSNGWSNATWQMDTHFHISSRCNPGYQLPAHFGSRAKGLGFVLDKSLITAASTKKPKSKKRSHSESESGDDSGSTSSPNDREERPERPRKSPRRSASPTSPAQEQATQLVIDLAHSTSPAEEQAPQAEVDRIMLLASAHELATQPVVNPALFTSPAEEQAPQAEVDRIMLPASIQEPATQDESNPGGHVSFTSPTQTQASSSPAGSDGSLFGGDSPVQEQASQAERSSSGLALPGSVE